VSDEEVRSHFERVFREHYDAVLAYAVARADVELAKDAVAATFVVAWRRRSEIPAEPRAWLIGVTRRTLADQRRTRARYVSLTLKLAAQPVAFEDEPDLSEPLADSNVVILAFRRLRPADQELLWLVACEGLTNAEVAGVLHFPRPVIAARLHRARRRFRAALGTDDDAEEDHPASQVNLQPGLLLPIALEDQ
jgi:RNA polymerase sigma-70 factor (ECF subfamily)